MRPACALSAGLSKPSSLRLRAEKRVRDNLDLVLPDTPDAETRRITARVANNAGGTPIEFYSGDDFLARVKDARQSGPGLSAIHDAQNRGAKSFF